MICVSFYILTRGDVLVFGGWLKNGLEVSGWVVMAEIGIAGGWLGPGLLRGHG